VENSFDREPHPLKVNTVSSELINYTVKWMVEMEKFLPHLDLNPSPPPPQEKKRKITVLEENFPSSSAPLLVLLCESEYK
jgi:hypothetical protein